MSSARDIQVLKLGVRFDPPCLILLYKFMKSTKLRSMPIRDLKKSSDCYKVAGKLKLQHGIVCDFREEIQDLNHSNIS